MNRRDFIKQTALLAAGAAALPAQIAAFEQLFDVNSRHLGATSGLIKINDIFIGGVAEQSTPALIEFLDGERLLMPFVLNAFGGMMRYVPAPDMPFFTSIDRLRWRAELLHGPAHTHPASVLRGTIWYTDSDLVFRTVPMDLVTGRLPA